jgi:hypothetical protein
MSRQPLLADDRFGQAWLIRPPCRAPIGYAVVIGSRSVESGGRDCILDELYVRDRGQGIGARAMPEIMAAPHAAVASAMFLETEAHTTRASVLGDPRLTPRASNPARADGLVRGTDLSARSE